MKNKTRKLPEFVKNHVLVAFHRGETKASIREANNSMTNEEMELQDRLTLPESERLSDDGGYVSDDVVVVNAPEKAQGVTSLDPTLPSQVPVDFEGPLDALDLEFPEELSPGDYQMHRPILDIDFPAGLVPSTTEGHFHLYLDRPMTWLKYKRLLLVLAEVGIIEHGYAHASIDRGYSSTRLPWVKKEPKSE